MSQRRPWDLTTGEKIELLLWLVFIGLLLGVIVYMIMTAF